MCFLIINKRKIFLLTALITFIFIVYNLYCFKAGSIQKIYIKNFLESTRDIQENEVTNDKNDNEFNIESKINMDTENRDKLIDGLNLTIFDERKLKLCTKWIILTTINQPTDHLKYINDASYGWCVLVVGDKKTPPDWNYREVYYLDVKTQIEILSRKFKIIKMIPFNSYLRKMVGYLFAIDNKAKFIYETDDDNSPLDGLFGFRYENFNGLESNCEENDNLFINPYNYFGQSSTWPRFENIFLNFYSR